MLQEYLIVTEFVLSVIHWEAGGSCVAKIFLGISREVKFGKGSNLPIFVF